MPNTHHADNGRQKKPYPILCSRESKHSKKRERNLEHQGETTKGTGEGRKSLGRLETMGLLLAPPSGLARGRLRSAVEPRRVARKTRDLSHQQQQKFNFQRRDKKNLLGHRGERNARKKYAARSGAKTTGPG